MNLIQRQIIDLLNASIHNTVPKLDYSRDVDWDEVLRLVQKRYLLDSEEAAEY